MLDHTVEPWRPLRRDSQFSARLPRLGQQHGLAQAAGGTLASIPPERLTTVSTAILAGAAPRLTANSPGDGQTSAVQENISATMMSISLDSPRQSGTRATAAVFRHASLNIMARSDTRHYQHGHLPQ